MAILRFGATDCGKRSRWCIIWQGQSWVVVTTTTQDWPRQGYPPTLWQLCEDKRRSVLSGDDDGDDYGGDYGGGYGGWGW